MSSQTSLISILSSTHGRLRREQRDISKRDLQKALKYGSRSRCWGQRWKVEYDGIVFITDYSARREVTSYPSPLSLAPLDTEQIANHAKAKMVLEKNPTACASHTVFVVDSSGSMMTHDINLHRDRQTAAYTTTALEFIAEQLFSGTANNSDAISLIEFGKTAKKIFTREPASWKTFNMLLERRDARHFTTRASHILDDLVTGDTMYMPALDEAQNSLNDRDHDSCALCLYFLTDGAPSDGRHRGLTPQGETQLVAKRLVKIAKAFGQRLVINLVGFGSTSNDFASLRAMEKAVQESGTGASAEFVYCGRMAHAMGNAATSAATSLTLTKTQLQSGALARNFTERKGLKSENSSTKPEKWDFFRILSHHTVERQSGKFVVLSGAPPAAIQTEKSQQVVEKAFYKTGRKLPPFLSMNSYFFGKGAERVAYRCFLADAKTEGSKYFDEMIAKETIHVERVEENINFHGGFLEAQSLASFLAGEFNERLDAVPGDHSSVEFVPCSVLVVEDFSFPNNSRGILVEKKLDTDSFPWTKWNDNAGTVDGRRAHIPLDLDFELKAIERDQTAPKSTKVTFAPSPLMCIAEGDESEEDETDEEESVGSANDDESMELSDDPESLSEFKDSDYLQAFSHFTYLYTCKKLLVCDLQGIFNTETRTFELTDPAIHYKSNRSRKMVFGRTDKGRKGIQLFFNTHKCTRICKMMQLSRKNSEWKKKWRQTQSNGP